MLGFARTGGLARLRRRIAFTFVPGRCLERTLHRQASRPTAVLSYRRCYMYTGPPAGFEPASDVRCEAHLRPLRGYPLPARTTVRSARADRRGAVAEPVGSLWQPQGSQRHLLPLRYPEARYQSPGGRSSKAVSEVHQSLETAIISMPRLPVRAVKSSSASGEIAPPLEWKSPSIPSPRCETSGR